MKPLFQQMEMRPCSLSAWQKRKLSGERVGIRAYTAISPLFGQAGLAGVYAASGLGVHQGSTGPSSVTFQAQLVQDKWSWPLDPTIQLQTMSNE